MRIILLTLLIARECACYGPAASFSRIQIPATPPPVAGRKYSWAEAGLSLTLPDGWRRSDSNEPDKRAWAGPDELSLELQAAAEPTNWGPAEFDAQTKSFYESLRKTDKQDVRYLTIDGVRGIHWLRTVSPDDSEQHTIITWNAFRPFRGKGQVIFLQLVSPASTFAQNREPLYRLLAAIRFTEQDLAPSGGNSPEGVSVDVGIPADGEFYLGKRRIAREQIVSEIDQLLRDQPEEKQLVFIKALPEVSYRTVLDLIHDLGMLGYERIGLIGAASDRLSLPRTRTGKAFSASGNSNPQPAAGEGHLVVTVRISKAQAMIAVDGKNVSLQDLSAYTHKALEQRAAKTVIIQGDPNASYGLILSIIKELKAGGAEPIGVDRLKD